MVGAAILSGALPLSSPALAQANGEAGAALLGIARAQAHSEARAKSNMNPTGQHIPSDKDAGRGAQHANAQQDD